MTHTASSQLRPLLGLQDAFGARAAALRSLQFRLLELYNLAGFEEVIPPLLERPEALGIGAGRFLADQTIVFSDPAEAGLVALRPDITPQIARIAATSLQHESDLRLSYSGTVMLARPDGRSGSRQQWQTGLERLGAADSLADIEVMHLAAMSMHTAGFDNPVLMVGHLGLLRALLEGAQAPLEQWVALLARRSPEDLKALLSREHLPPAASRALLDMAAGLADGDWLRDRRESINARFTAAAAELLELVAIVSARLEAEVAVRIDAALMPRFLYHSGILFAGYADGAPQALLHGGRYDDMMRALGRNMPATGFSFDLWSWLDAGAV